MGGKIWLPSATACLTCDRNLCKRRLSFIFYQPLETPVKRQAPHLMHRCHASCVFRRSGGHLRGCCRCICVAGSRKRCASRDNLRSTLLSRGCCPSQCFRRSLLSRKWLLVLKHCSLKPSCVQPHFRINGSLHILNAQVIQPNLKILAQALKRSRLVI